MNKDIKIGDITLPKLTPMDGAKIGALIGLLTPVGIITGGVLGAIYGVVVGQLDQNNLPGN